MKDHASKLLLITVAKVLAIMAVAAFAMPYLFGFAVGFFNSMAAGYVAVGLTACAGICAICLVVSKAVRSNRVGKEGGGAASSGPMN